MLTDGARSALEAGRLVPVLLIAVSGPVGSGKTMLLARFAAWVSERGLRVDGFLALAEGRTEATRGAADYVLFWPATSERTPYAHRQAQDHGYDFDPATEDVVAAWADTLTLEAVADVIVLDEFGKREAQGLGHAAILSRVLAVEPRCLAIAIRSGVQDSIETLMGRTFDLVIDASDPRALERMQEAYGALDDWQRVGVYGSGSGGIEMSVGAALHGIKFPLTGLVMSTTQSVVLAAAVGGLARRDRVVWVPFIAAGLKALSPTGSRLGPMLAISVQGILFSLVTRFFGTGRLALFFAGFLVGAWAGAQGVLIQYVLVGDNLFKAYAATARWLAERWSVSLPSMVALVLTLTLGFGLVAGTATTAFAGRRAKASAIRQALEERASQLQIPERADSQRRAWLLGGRDLLRPSFWAPVLIVLLVLKLAGTQDLDLFWIVFRAVAVAFVLFSLIRVVDPIGLVRWLRRKGHWGPALAFDRALRRRRI